MNIVSMLGLALVGGIVCGVITSVILIIVFQESIQDIVRYLDSIRKEVDVALDELSGAKK